MYAAVLNELVERGVVRTRNAPAGDCAEWLRHQASDGALEPTSRKSHDITLDDGTRLQVKCRVVSNPVLAGERQLSVIRSWEFDQLMIVLLDRVDYSIRQAVMVLVEVARGGAYLMKHVNGDGAHARPELLAHTESRHNSRLVCCRRTRANSPGYFPTLRIV